MQLCLLDIFYWGCSGDAITVQEMLLLLKSSNQLKFHTPIYTAGYFTDTVQVESLA